MFDPWIGYILEAMTVLQLDSRHFARLARLYYVLTALSTLWYPRKPGVTWSGDEGEGMFTNLDGIGDWWGIAWSGAGLVALAFSSESDREEVEVERVRRRPLRWLPGLPASLRPLAKRLASQHDDLTTAGLWICGPRHRQSDRWDRPFIHGLAPLRRYTLDAESALFAAQPYQSWLHLSSLSEPQARLALRLAEAAAHGPVTLTAEDEAVLLQPPPQAAENFVTSAAAAATAKVLAPAGVLWQPDLERLDAAQRDREAARVAQVRASLGRPVFELFEAARGDDIDRVRALIADGVSLEVRTVDEQWKDTPGGDTPLIQALKAGASRVAALLIAAGADLSARNDLGQTAVWWAGHRGDAENLATLLARGADPNSTAHDDRSVLHVAVGQGTAIVTTLLRAGADPTALSWSRNTPGDYARKQGHTEVAALLAAASQRS